MTRMLYPTRAEPVDWLAMCHTGVLGSNQESRETSGVMKLRIKVGEQHR